jgi:hypothetical protein
MRGPKTFWSWLKKINSSQSHASFIDGIIFHLDMQLVDTKDPLKPQLCFRSEAKNAETQHKLDIYDDQLGFKIFCGQTR